MKSWLFEKSWLFVHHSTKPEVFGYLHVSFIELTHEFNSFLLTENLFSAEKKNYEFNKKKNFFKPIIFRKLLTSNVDAATLTRIYFEPKSFKVLQN